MGSQNVTGSGYGSNISVLNVKRANNNRSDVTQMMKQCNFDCKRVSLCRI